MEGLNVLFSVFLHIACMFWKSLSASCFLSFLQLYRIGGCGYKMLLLLEGIAHAYIYASPGCKRWDTCAGEALLNAIGGKMTGIDGREYSYAANVEPMAFRGVIATPNKSWHDEYVKRMPPETVKNLVDAAPPNE